ncbi:beta family protein [Mesorhizobium sp. BR115XR7A]|uniref:beta family protein n=1 Tax=Mesorhizobium sp. BR115XR7A TaxID=2876645 RepID=UPI001CCD4CE6|nr:beta family protein [Mesorhizobium sp. BR115XR7A]MBZ9906123.1 beta family protein [Mesorhizobium sp. BR115XR7A]MBZ9934155.1 beta family protein [Mesorhizobium sp. BR1-1-5]
MNGSKTYFPAIATRQAEMRALGRLAGPTKDLLLPLIKLQAWPRIKQSDTGFVSRSLNELFEAFGARRVIIDLASPRYDRESEAVSCGRAEISALHAPIEGFRAWVDLMRLHAQFIPVVQWTIDQVILRQEVQELLALDRGLVFRLKRGQNWNLDGIDLLGGISFRGSRVLVIVDCEQIALRDDLTLLASAAQRTILYAKSKLAAPDLHFVVIGSSFPSSFSDIHPTTAKLDIRERQIFSLLRESPPLLRQGIQLQYGDHASVYAAERTPSFRGSPRVDYPAPHRWIYHRRPASEGFGVAAKAITDEDDWDKALLCWGAQEIRRAAAGDVAGLNSASPWTAVRINVHLHQQAHFSAGGASVIEEAWTD